MDRNHIAQQTSSTLPLHSELDHAAPRPRPLSVVRFRGVLQWMLEGPGWSVVRPSVDFALLCAAVILSLGAGAVDRPSGGRASLLALPALVMLLLGARGLYRNRLRAPLLNGISPVVSCVSIGATGVAALGLLLGHPPSQSDLVRTWLFALLALGSGRAALSAAKGRARTGRRVGKPVLVVGAGVVGVQIAHRLENHPEYGLAPVGFLDDDPLSGAAAGGRDLPVLGPLENLDAVLRNTSARHIIVAFSSSDDARLSRLVQHCHEKGITVSVVPRMFDAINDRAEYGNVGGLPLMTFNGVDPRGWLFALKHAADRAMALVMLVVLSPLMVAVAIGVRLSSPGPALFRQRRVGRDGRPFDLLKFRSMRPPPDEPDRGEAVSSNAFDLLLAGDLAPGGVEGKDRRTAIGRVLRRTSLDELPQLINVLRGEMSLIGPRPERPEFVEIFQQDIARYGDRHRVKSGITGWAQVHGLRGQTSLAERVEWDNYYITHWSPALDLKILLLTFAAIFHDAE